MAKEKVKIAVRVQSGVVDKVFCNVPAEFTVLDYDLLDSGDFDDINETSENCPEFNDCGINEKDMSEAIAEYQAELQKLVAELEEE